MNLETADALIKDLVKALRARLETALTYRTEVADMGLFRGLSPGELDVLLARLRACLPDAAHPLASAALERACERIGADEKLARRLAAELLLDSLPRVLAAAA